MASEPIHITDDSELPDLLDAAKKGPVEFERKGVVYILESRRAYRNDWTEEDREEFERALEKTAGSWRDTDADQMIEDLYKARSGS